MLSATTDVSKESKAPSAANMNAYSNTCTMWLKLPNTLTKPSSRSGSPVGIGCLVLMRATASTSTQR